MCQPVRYRAGATWSPRPPWAQRQYRCRGDPSSTLIHERRRLVRDGHLNSGRYHTILAYVVGGHSLRRAQYRIDQRTRVDHAVGGLKLVWEMVGGSIIQLEVARDSRSPN